MQGPDLTTHENIKSIYKSCFNQVKSMVHKNSGTIDDAQEVFQEAMIVLYQKSISGNFKLTANVCTFLYRVAYNKWMQAIKPSAKIVTGVEELAIADNPTIAEEELKTGRQILLMNCIETLGEKCRKLVELFLSGVPGEKIAEQLGHSSYEYYRLAKKRCLDTLKTRVQQNKSYSELKFTGDE